MLDGGVGCLDQVGSRLNVAQLCGLAQGVEERGDFGSAFRANCRSDSCAQRRVPAEHVRPRCCRGTRASFRRTASASPSAPACSGPPCRSRFAAIPAGSVPIRGSSSRSAANVLCVDEASASEPRHRLETGLEPDARPRPVPKLGPFEIGHKSATWCLCLRWPVSPPAPSKIVLAFTLAFRWASRTLPSVTSSLGGINHPTRCDVLLYPPSVSPPVDDAACAFYLLGLRGFVWVSPDGKTV